jgi:hypothetical protein
MLRGLCPKVRRVLRRLASTAAIALVAWCVAAGSAGAAAPEPVTGRSHDDPYPSPHGLVLRGSHGYEIIVGALAAERGSPAEAQVRIYGPTTDTRYTVHANLAGEGIHANFGRFGRVDLRWVPSGRVREIKTHCDVGLGGPYFFATGSYVGTVRLRGGNGFTEATAHRIAWRRSWYSRHYDCGFSISEGKPGPGAILGAESRPKHGEPVELFVVKNGAGERVQTSANGIERIGRVTVGHYAYVLAGPKTLTVDPSFRTAELSPPAPFSGTGRFERTHGGRGTWRGDLSVEFPDGTDLRLAGKNFEASLHSGYYEIHERP